MSSEAITKRLRQTDQLRELSLSLIKAKKVADEKKKIDEREKTSETSRLPTE